MQKCRFHKNFFTATQDFQHNAPLRAVNPAINPTAGGGTGPETAAAAPLPGAGSVPGGPPPSANDSFLYLSGDHFNFGALQSTELTIEALYLPFTDVQADRWSRDAIYDMAATGTMLGMDQTEFASTGTMTRAMAITVLYRMAGSPETAGTVKYTDTQATAYYADALVWGTQSGIVNGYKDGTFRPASRIIREEAAAMLSRLLDLMQQIAQNRRWSKSLQRLFEPVEKPVGFFDKVSCRTLRAPVVRLRRTTNTLASYIVFCVVYTPLRKIDLILFAASAANSARLF